MKSHTQSGNCLIWITIICSVLLTGCVSHTEHHNAASVVDFLYPDVKDPVITPGIPVLKLPLRVGIAFVPGVSYGSALTEQRKMDLMKQVATRFKNYPFIKDIELIPSAYLRNKGGFSNLEQIRTMYGVDVVALVSYDQVQFTDQGLLSLTYWTIVGAYVVPGEKNDTQTLLDTVVVDISSKKMLFRAPGMDHVKGNSTPINLSEQLRIDSEASFGKAAAQMIENLDQQLAVFKDKVKEHPDDYKVVRTAEYQARSGGGSVDTVWIGLISLLGLGSFLFRRYSLRAKL
jgi:rhombotail lipoprotein